MTAPWRLNGHKDVCHKGRMLNVIFCLFGALWVLRIAWAHLWRDNLHNFLLKQGSSGVNEAQQRPFWRDLMRLVKICFPSLWSGEALALMAYVLALLLRTSLSLAVLRTESSLAVQMLHYPRHMLKRVAWWVAQGTSLCWLNAVMTYLKRHLALRLRMRLCWHATQLLAKPSTHCSLTRNAQNIANPGHRLTHSITEWSDRFSSTITTAVEPLLDVVFFSSSLLGRIGWYNYLGGTVMVWESGQLLRRLRPSFSAMLEEKVFLEGKLHREHAAVVNFSEGIAFLNGELVEQSRLQRTFEVLIAHTACMIRQRFYYVAAERFVVQYIWNIVSLVQIAISKLRSSSSLGEQMESFLSLRRLLSRVLEAAGRLTTGVKDVEELKGITAVVLSLFDALESAERAAGSDKIGKCFNEAVA